MSFTKNAPDEEAVRLLRYYEGLALHYDVRGYCVCTSEGKDSRVLGHLMRRAGVGASAGSSGMGRSPAITARMSSGPKPSPRVDARSRVARSWPGTRNDTTPPRPCVVGLQ